MSLNHIPDGTEAHARCARPLTGEKFSILLPHLPVKAVLHGDGTNLRKEINGLTSLIKTQSQIDLFQRAIFLFRERRERHKALYWEGDGFLLLHKIKTSYCPF